MSDIEAEIQAKGLTAPRVTPADIEAAIVHTEIVEHSSVRGQVLRWAVLTTRNGFAVTGRPSVAVSPENDDEHIGRKVAIDNAKQELWPLLGYELRSKLAAQPAMKAPRYTKRADVKRVTCIEVPLKYATSFTAEMVDGLSVTFEVENSKLSAGIGMDLMLPVILEAANKQAAALAQ